MLHKIELHSVKRTKKEKKKHNSGEAVGYDKHDDYPWETRMDLGNEVVEKVPGLERVAVGEEIMIEAMARVVRKSSNESESVGEKASNRTTIEIQITEMGMAPKGTYEDAFKERAKQKRK